MKYLLLLLLLIPIVSAIPQYNYNTAQSSSCKECCTNITNIYNTGGNGTADLTNVPYINRSNIFNGSQTVNGLFSVYPDYGFCSGTYVGNGCIDLNETNCNIASTYGLCTWLPAPDSYCTDTAFSYDCTALDPDICSLFDGCSVPESSQYNITTNTKGQVTINAYSHPDDKGYLNVQDYRNNYRSFWVEDASGLGNMVRAVVQSGLCTGNVCEAGDFNFRSTAETSASGLVADLLGKYIDEPSGNGYAVFVFRAKANASTNFYDPLIFSEFGAIFGEDYNTFTNIPKAAVEIKNRRQTSPNLYITKANGQTLDLAQWGNLSGTVFGKIDVNGNLNTTNVTGTYIFGNGTGLKGICLSNGTGCPTSSSGSYNTTYDATTNLVNSRDMDFDYNTEWTMFEPFTNNGAIEAGEVGLYGWNYATAGGTVTVNTPYVGNHPGVIRLSTSTSSTGNASMDLGISTITLDSLSGNLTGVWMVNMSNPVDAAENYTLYIGFHDSTGTARIPVDGVYFMTNITYPNWTAVSSSNSVRTINTTNNPINGSWTKLRIDINNESGVYVKRFYINDVQVIVQNATNLPLGTARTFGTAVQLYKSLNATARTIDIDYYYFKQRFQVPR